MRAKARLLGHPIHQMLVVFPLGLLGTSVIFDFVYLATRSPDWALVSFWMLVAGVIGGLAAAVFGLIDWTAIPPRTRAKRVGFVHGAGNVVVLLLFSASAASRPEGYEPASGAIALSVLAFLLSGVTGWLGGELVDRLAVGVDDDAHLDADSSLRLRRSAEDRTPMIR